MEHLSGFCDLCLSNYRDLKELTLMLRECFELEYRNVAIEQIYDDVTTDQKAKKNDPIPEPLDLSIFQDEFQGKLKLFNRISVVFAENSVSLTTNKSQNLRKYHLFAAVPTTESALTYACQSLNCDLISYNSETLRVKIARKHYFEACSRNIYFEIKYAPCIVDSEVRKATITKALKYHALGKSKNIIMSSGATEQFELRSPYDVAHLGWIFSLSEEQSKDSISGKTRRLLLRAETRKCGASMVYVRKLKELGVSKEEEISDSEPEENMSVSEEEEETTESACKKQKVN